MKKYAIGFIVGAMLMLSTNAFAAIGDIVQATFASYNYVVNNESKTVDSPVLVYEGTSYVRTTDISNMLGYDVTYKSDSRSIEFNGTLPPAPEPSTTPAPSGEPTPTPAPSGSVTPTPDSAVTPTPSLEPTPTPTPDNTVACQAIRDDYNGQIVAVGYGGGTDGQKRLKEYQLGYYRDQALAAAGC